MLTIIFPGAFAQACKYIRTIGRETEIDATFTIYTRPIRRCVRVLVFAHTRSAHQRERERSARRVRRRRKEEEEKNRRSDELANIQNDFSGAYNILYLLHV